MSKTKIEQTSNRLKKISLKYEAETEKLLADKALFGREVGRAVKGKSCAKSEKRTKRNTATTKEEKLKPQALKSHND